jgi:hypothetical protein
MSWCILGRSNVAANSDTSRSSGSMACCSACRLLVQRWYRGERDIAIDAAKLLKTRQPYSKVVIRDLWTGAKIDHAPTAGQS